MNNQIETFSFSPPINLSEECKWLVAVASLEATISVFNISDENNACSISLPGHWIFPNYLEADIIDQLKILLKLKSQIDIKLHVQEIRKKGNQIKINSKEFF